MNQTLARDQFEKPDEQSSVKFVSLCTRIVPFSSITQQWESLGHFFDALGLD